MQYLFLIVKHADTVRQDKNETYNILYNIVDSLMQMITVTARSITVHVMIKNCRYFKLVTDNFAKENRAIYSHFEAWSFYFDNFLSNITSHRVVYLFSFSKTVENSTVKTFFL